MKPESIEIVFTGAYSSDYQWRILIDEAGVIVMQRSLLSDDAYFGDWTIFEYPIGNEDMLLISKYATAMIETFNALHK